jgi:CubicO group peptidase (beta-lactamase class C family)
MISKIISSLSAILLVSILSCEKDPAAILGVEAFPWPHSSPQSQGFDTLMLDQAFTAARNKTFSYSLLIIRNGYLIREEYFHGRSRNSTSNIQSVSKSFISALVGIALREGFLDSLGQKMLDFFPEYNRAGLDPRKKDITIQHLLQMRAGFNSDIEDYDINWYHWVQSPDWVKYIIEWPLSYNPGIHFSYITAESHLLSVILAKASGMDTRTFAQKYLFEPLQISINDWEKDPQGYYIGGMKMYIVPRNLARFGYLYLLHGQIDGRQIVPETWVRDSYHAWSYLGSSWGDLDQIGYGYQWWLGKIRQKQVYMALGYGGQFIMIFPQYDMIVVTTCDSDFYKDTADLHEREMMAIVANYIIPAIGSIDVAFIQ